jgi:hypothetical protein
LRILSQRAVSLIGDAAQIGADLFVQGGRIVMSGLVGIGRGLLQNIRTLAQRQVQQAREADTVLEDAGEYTAPPLVHIRQRTHPNAYLLPPGVNYGLRSGEVFRSFGHRQIAAEQTRPATRRQTKKAVRLRQRTHPNANVIEEGVNVGLRRGQVFRPFGQQNTAAEQTRPTTRSQTRPKGGRRTVRRRRRSF